MGAHPRVQKHRMTLGVGFALMDAVDLSYRCAPQLNAPQDDISETVRYSMLPVCKQYDVISRSSAEEVVRRIKQRFLQFVDSNVKL